MTGQYTAWVVFSLSIAILLAISIIDSQRFGITGLASSSGNVSVTVNSTTSLKFAVSSVDWGTGSVNPAIGTCNLTTDSGNIGCLGFATVSQGLVIENDGNVNMTISLYSNKSAFDFVGPDSKFMWKINNYKQGSCASPSPSAYSDVNVSSVNATTICPSLYYIDTNDSITINLKVVIPLSLHSVSSGLKTTTIVATGS